MIKKIASVALVAGALSACSALKSLGVDQKTIDSIQEASVAVCGFLPTVETVVNLVSGGGMGVPAEVANILCKAVTAGQPTTASLGRLGMPAAAPRAVPPGANVKGVQIEGKFVR